MERVYVVDAGVLFTKWTDQHLNSIFVTTNEVLDEILNRPSRQRIEFLLSAGRLRVETYNPSVFRRIEKAAIKSGDKLVLSNVDKSLIALALTRKESNLPSTIVSTDLAILNTAIGLGLDVVDPMNRLKHQIIWIYRCPSCGYVPKHMTSDLVCPLCGSTMRRRSRNRRPI